MNLENRIKQYLDNSIEFVEWQKDGLTLNDVAWLMEDFINNDRLVCKNNKPFAIPAVSVSVCPHCQNDSSKIVESEKRKCFGCGRLFYGHTER